MTVPRVSPGDHDEPKLEDGASASSALAPFCTDVVPTLLVHLHINLSDDSVPLFVVRLRGR